jgi:hypothetical protein
MTSVGLSSPIPAQCVCCRRTASGIDGRHIPSAPHARIRPTAFWSHAPEPCAQVRILPGAQWKQGSDQRKGRSEPFSSMPKRTRLLTVALSGTTSVSPAVNLLRQPPYSRRSDRHASNADQPFVPLGERYGPHSPANRPAYGQRRDLRRSRKRTRSRVSLPFRLSDRSAGSSDPLRGGARCWPLTPATTY